MFYDHVHTFGKHKYTSPYPGVLQGFNWTRFIQGVLSSVSINVQLEEEVVVYSSPYLEKMNEVLPKYSVRSVSQYSAPISAERIKQNQKKHTVDHPVHSDSGFCFQDNTELPHLAAHL